MPSPAPCWGTGGFSLVLPKIHQDFPTHTPPHPCSPELQRLEVPQDGKAEPVEEWAGQSPPELVLSGSRAPAVLCVAKRNIKESRGFSPCLPADSTHHHDLRPTAQPSLQGITCGRGGNGCHHGLMSDLVGDGVHELRGQGGQLDEGGAWGVGLM